MLASQRFRLLLTGLYRRMTPLNRARLKKFIGGLRPGGSTNFEAGFEKAFDILDEAERVGESSFCQSVILFMTDGQASDPTSTVNLRNGGPYTSSNPQTEAGRYTRIFTYSFGGGAESTAMRSIACNNGGVFHQISDRDGPRLKEIMANYFVRPHRVCSCTTPDARCPGVYGLGARDLDRRECASCPLGG